MRHPTGKLAGKVALVTGGGRGLGRAYALRLAALGADVVVNDISLNSFQEYGEELSAETVIQEIEALGVRALGVEADATDKEQVAEMFAQVDAAFGRLDILVNNAGGALRGGERSEASSAPEADYRYILDVNLMDTILCCQAAAPLMKRQHSGKIVNIGSQAGLHAQIGGRGAPYSVAKAGVIQYTRLLAAELGAYGINVNCMAPGWILSSRAIAQGRSSPETRARLESQIALGRLGTPEDCAKVLEFLVTDLSDYVTGQCITVCGGYVLF
jgi:NAD(P)-dependent dehydrogenase (short-subunit alcohol dehydrogenase family)